MKKEMDELMFSHTVDIDEAERILILAARIPGILVRIADYDGYKDLGRKIAVTVKAVSDEAISQYSDAVYPKSNKGGRRKA